MFGSMAALYHTICRVTLSLCYLLLVLVLSAQERQSPLEDQLIEQLLEQIPEDMDPTDLLERWRFYMEYPLSLNAASAKDFQELIFLSPLKIEALIAYRTTYGLFQNLWELQAVPGFSIQDINQLLPFIQLGPKPPKSTSSWKERLQDLKHDLIIRHAQQIETAQGYRITDADRARYLGDKNRYLVRYRARVSDKIQFSINMKKDAGEPFFAGNQKYGFDFYSMSLSVKQPKKLKHIIIGDYALQLGQGLVLWNGLALGKGAMIPQVARQGLGLRPYTSTLEYQYFRGIAATYQMKQFSITPFSSYNLIDATVLHTDSGRYISSFGSTGYHRTVTENNNRKAASEWVSGLNMQYDQTHLSLGISAVHTAFDGFKIPPPAFRNQFDFSGNKLSQLHAYYNITQWNTYFYGEYARALGAGDALVVGMLRNLSPELSLVWMYRKYAKDYHQFWAQAVAETTGTRNEEGMYTGLVYQISRRLEWHSYFDIFRFPEPRYLADHSSKGVDFLSQIQFITYQKSKFSLRYRYRYREENHFPTGSIPNPLAPIDRNQFRMEYQYHASKLWSLRSRIELVSFQKHPQAAEFGAMIFQDVFLNFKRLRTNFRMAYFSTESYASRIYAFENDILYAASIPAYDHRGFRIYINARVQLWSKLNLWLRVSRFHYLNRHELGSGLDRIDGSKRTEVKWQLRYQF